VGCEEMAIVDQVKISDGNRQLEMAWGTAGERGTEMNRTVNWM